MISDVKDAVVPLVAKQFGIPRDLILGPSKARQVFEARAATMYLVRWVSRAGYKPIAEAYGCDHGTVINAVERAEQLMAIDRGFASRVEAARAEVPNSVHPRLRGTELERWMGDATPEHARFLANVAELLLSPRHGQASVDFQMGRTALFYGRGGALETRRVQS